MPTKEQDLYDISAVSRLTGLSAPNLRMWEKRYGLVSPVRTESKRRLYSPEDVKRLGLLKSLVDRGSPIRSIADLTTDQLEARIAEEESRRGDDLRGSESLEHCRALVVGAELQALLESEETVRGVELVAGAANLTEATELTEPLEIDLVLVEAANLFPETVTQISTLVTTLKAQRAVVVYRFADPTAKAMIAKSMGKLTPVRGPVNGTELRLACLLNPRREAGGRDPGTLESTSSPSSNTIPDRLFSESQLARLSHASTSIQCECPRHLSDLLASLCAFETYSAQCESRSPEDAELHTEIHRTTAEVRFRLEETLQKVLVADEIELG